METISVQDFELSDIQKFYAEKTIFVTGATGFIGKLLVEKLLRTCPDIKKVYILIRPKKGKTIKERYEEFLDNILLERIKREQPNFSKKIALVSGDCEQSNLGLNETNKELLIDEVNAVFHCAATVRFDEPLRKSAYINVRAVKDILNIAKQMKNLKSFVHVSTAYSNCVREEIDEKIYEPTISGNQLLTLVDILSDDVLANILPILLGDWPNTYVFTKAVGEEMVRSEGKGLPVAITRPSIVIGTFKEPVGGWIDNIYGATGIFLGASLGLIHTLNCDPDVLADMVPADYFVNCTIAAAWERGISKKEEIEDDMPVYNYVCSIQKPITWRKMMSILEIVLMSLASPLILWYPFIFLNTNIYMYKVNAFLMHTIPAYLVDMIAFCLGKERLLVKGYKKIHKFLDVLSYFATKQWRFYNNNTQHLWKRLSKSDQKNFEFDMNLFDWETYVPIYSKGGRIYLLKDPIETIPQGRSKYLKLKIAHYILMVILLILLMKFFLMLWSVVV